MKKIALTAAAVLAITGSAFAGSDNYGSNGANQPAATVDSSYTVPFTRTRLPFRSRPTPDKQPTWQRPQPLRQQLTADPRQHSGGLSPPLGDPQIQEY